MNRINPLYIGLLLVVVLFLSLFELSLAKKELHEVKKNLAKTTTLAIELSELKKVYANQKNLQNKLKRILNQKLIRTAGIVAKYKKNNVKISAESLDKRSLDFLMSKILNATFNISSFEIKRLSPYKASFNMEIKW